MQATATLDLSEHRLYRSPVELGAVREALAVRDRDFHDETVPASRLSLDEGTGKLVVQNGDRHEHVLQDQAVNLIASRLRIPAEYLKRCPPELRAENVNHWLGKLGEKPLLVRFDRTEVRAILTSRYVPVSNLAVIDRLLAKIGDDRQPVRFEVSALRMVAQVVTNRRGHAVRPNDLVQGGVTVENSEVGFASLSLTAFLLRLVCTNGMTSEENVSFRRIHTADAEQVLGKVGETFAKIGSAMPATVERFAASLRVSVKKPEVLLESIGKRFKLVESEREAVSRAWPEEAGETLFHVVNAITRAANDAALDLESRSRLQRVGGLVLAGHAIPTVEESGGDGNGDA